MSNDDAKLVRTQALVRADSSEAAARLEPKVRQADRLRKERSLSENTQRAYGAHLRHWEAWAAAHGLHPFPATVEMVEAYVWDHEALLDLPPKHPDRVALATLRARLAAVARRQQDEGGLPVTRAPQVLELVRVLKRNHGFQAKKEPLRVDELRRMVTTLPRTLIGHRDRALLLLGFMGALRRSELVAFDVDDVRHVPEGLELTIWKSKTDQEERGEVLGVHATHTELCPADAIVRWLDESKITDGRLFRHVKSGSPGTALTPGAVGNIVKGHAERIGLDPARFGGHSLRAGFATEASRLGFNLAAIASQTRHKNLETLHGYIRRGSLFENNPSAVLAGADDGKAR